MLDVYDKLPTSHELNNGKVRTADVLQDERVKFSTLLLQQNIQRGLNECRYIYLSPIQQNALPLALTGASLIAHAKSGTGKTLIYLLTALNNFLKEKSNHLQCLILSPTREIAKQVYDIFKNVGSYIEDLKVEYFIGGTPVDIDVIKCKNCHIAIGAPGRIKHLMQLGDLKTEHLQLLVLDEVDALLNHKEFAISELVSYFPKSKQTIVCTATFSKNIKELLKPIASNIKYVTIENTESEDIYSTSNILIGIKQYIAPVPTDCTSLDTTRKRNKLIQILRHFEYDQCFIFVNYISLVKSVCNLLANHNLNALWISSEQNQSTRINALNQLKLNQCQILVTTDLAARGIDVHNVNLVINLGLPCPADVYIHRMGRAGRYGSEGSVVTILYEGEEIEQFKKIVSIVSTDPVDLLVLPSEIDENMSNRNFEIIRCTPQQDYTMDNEFYFKRQIKSCRSNMSAVKKKKKKNKKNKNLMNDNHRYEKVVMKNCTKERIDKNDDFNTNAILTNPLKKKKIEDITASFIYNVKEEMNRKTISLNPDFLKDMFTSKIKPLENICLKTDFEQEQEVVNEKNTSNCEMFVTPVNENIVQCVHLLKKRNHYLDKQKMPCSIHEISDMLKQDDSILKDKSAKLPELIKNLLNKICTFLPNISESECIRKENVSKNVLNSSEKSLNGICKRFRFSDEFSNQTGSNESNENGHDTNLMLEHQNIEHNAKRSKYFHKMKSMRERKFIIEKNARELEDECVKTDLNRSKNLNENDISREHNNISSSKCVTMNTPLEYEHMDNMLSSSKRSTGCVTQTMNVDSSKSENANAKFINNSVTCPNCKFEFTIPNTTIQYTPILQSMRAFVDNTTERNIWNHHFNFINEHLQSFSSINHQFR